MHHGLSLRNKTFFIKCFIAGLTDKNKQFYPRNRDQMNNYNYSCILISYFLLFFIGLTGCSTLKPVARQPIVMSLPPAESGILNTVSSQIKVAHGPDQSGFLLLSNNRDALNWRLALIDHALKSIDAQYFIWQDDETGNLLLDRLLKAADRGVRVRLLVDDLALKTKNRDLALLTRNPRFQLKIFNPASLRESTLGGIGEFFLNFKQLNRRMHNKLFIVDGQMAIVGGRNIGNPYFGLSKTYNFRDLDVMTTGPVTRELSQAFDEYWNVDLAYPASAMAKIDKAEGAQSIQSSMAEYLKKSQSILAQYPLKRQNWEDQLRQLSTTMKPGEAHVIQDTPVSIDGKELRLIDMLDYLSKPNDDELIIVTPYLIPGDSYLKSLDDMAGEGVTVNIITNSLGSNNHTMVHSHYKKYRRKILATGTNLFEFSHASSTEMRLFADVPPVEANFISLHIKAMVGDRKRCFIGSLNHDPRAMDINTENGLYIESEPLARELAETFTQLMDPKNSWKVYLNKNNALRWKSSTATISSQPARGFGQRIADFFYRLLPIESQL